MTYRLITKAILTITSAAGVKSEREIEIRAFASPKRDAVGALTVDGVSVSYKRTGGKGRGTVDTRYMYFPAKGESAYAAITASEATALVGGTASIAALAPVTPVAPPAEAPAEAPAPTLTRAQRRASKQAA
jgi:hypothetical protein